MTDPTDELIAAAPNRMTALLDAEEAAALLPEGARVRHKRHSDLTGTVRYEWNRPGVLSGIPYRIEWDDSSLAHDRLGMFFVYSGPLSVERLTDDEPCPDCGKNWPDGAAACPACGLTIETIAERLAR